MERTEYVARKGRRHAYKILARKPEREIQHVSPRRRWEDNIKMELWETGCDELYWTQVAQDRDKCRAL
jgi:hypothetical protein